MGQLCQSVSVDVGIETSAVCSWTLALMSLGIRPVGISADQPEADLFVYVGGMTVPGKYVGGTPAEPDEVREINGRLDAACERVGRDPGTLTRSVMAARA